MNAEAKARRKARKKAARAGGGGGGPGGGVCRRCRKGVDGRSGFQDEYGVWLCASCYRRLNRKLNEKAEAINAEVNRPSMFGMRF